jgi:glycosyltransferase involved in cell wall biosynthesis
MRILFLCTDAYGGRGGIALYNRDLIEAFAARSDVEEIVVLPRLIHGEPGDIPPRVHFMAEASRGKAAYLKAVVEARRKKFDLVFCGHVNLLPVASFSRPVLQVHGIDVWKPPSNLLARRLVHNCSAIVSITAITRERLLSWSHYRGPVYLLPNAIRLDQYGVRPRRADLVERYSLAGKRVILTVGRLESAERYKGFDEVMEVLPRLPSDVVYLIAGGGNDFTRLQKRAVDLGVADRVMFTGRFADEDKADLYALADVYAMPGRGEGFGFVYLEALASGVPVIGSKHDGSREALLDGKLGLLVDPSNPAEIEAAIKEILARAATRQIPALLEHFSFANFKHRANAILDEIVSPRNACDDSKR